MVTCMGRYASRKRKDVEKKEGKESLKKWDEKKKKKKDL
jgi:hypothetical protein